MTKRRNIEDSSVQTKLWTWLGSIGGTALLTATLIFWLQGTFAARREYATPDQLTAIHSEITALQKSFDEKFSELDHRVTANRTDQQAGNTTNATNIGRLTTNVELLLSGVSELKDSVKTLNASVGDLAVQSAERKGMLEAIRTQLESASKERKQ